MEDIGSLIFYVILGIIALIGSIQGKNKKPNAPPKKVEQREDESNTTSYPQPPPAPARTMQAPPAPARTMQPPPAPPRPLHPTIPSQANTRQVQPQSRPQYIPLDSSMEGSYEEPMARAFRNEGSVSRSMAEAFAQEGSIENSMAAAFASEGSSGFKDFNIGDFVHTEISDSEIGDAPVYDYNARLGADILADGFDLKKAVIYTALLERKEYSV